MRHHALLAAAFSLVALPAHAQTRVALGERVAALPHGFSIVSSVRELLDGRVLVVDLREREVYVGDFSAQRVATIGRRGQGPLEYSRPIFLVALPEGRTLLQDPGNARFLEIGEDAVVKGALSIKSPDGEAFTLPPRSVGPDAWGSDRLGRLYFEPYPREAGTQIHSAIVRLDPRHATLDTVATFAVPKRTGTYSVSSPKPNEFVVQEHVWNPRTRWLVAADARIALVEPEPYRVAWLVDGKRTDGTPVRFTPVRVTEADREAYLEGLGRPAGAGGPAGTRASPVKREGDPIFPETMPPFFGRDAVHLTPDGQLWVARMKNASTPIQSYDIFDPSGRLTGRAELPPGRRIAGFGAREVYVIHRDDDGLEYLERYKR